MDRSLVYLYSFNRYLHNISKFYIICNDYMFQKTLYLINNLKNLFNIIKYLDNIFLYL